MFSRLHPMIKGALLLAVAEFFIASPAQQFYQWLPTKWQPTMPDFIPPGLFAGIAFGLVAALYYLRRDEPGWWRGLRS